MLGHRADEGTLTHRVDERGGRGRFGDDLRDDLALAERSADVPERVGFAHSRKGEGRGAVGVVAALCPHQARVAVVDVGVVAEVDSADGLDEGLDPAHGNLDVMVHLQAAQFLDGAHEQLGSADRIGRVELAGVVARDCHVGVAGKGDESGLPGLGDVQEHDRVRTLPGGGIVDRALLALVGADHEVRRARGVGFVGKRIDVVELRVSVMDEVRRPGDEKHQKDDEGDAYAAAPRVPAARLRRRIEPASRFRRVLRRLCGAARRLGRALWLGGPERLGRSRKGPTAERVRSLWTLRA